MTARTALTGLFLLVALGCQTEGIQDPGPPPPPPPPPVPPAGLVLSEPLTPVAGPARGTATPRGLLTATEVYVSLLPGTVSAGVVAEIRNRSQGLARSAFLFAGGFDPVAISGAAGDTLELTVRGATGNVLLTGKGLVPLTRRPIVVRTNPPPKKRDVPLNATLVVVFSEPVIPATVTGTSLVVASGAGAVAGQVSLSANGTQAEFVPAGLLSPATNYTITLTAAVTSRSGAPLEPLSFEFTSAATTEGLGMSQIVYTGCAVPTPIGNCGIFVMNADGTNVRQLTEAVSDNFDSSPAWSPDGSMIAFSSHRHCALTGRIPVYLQGTCQRETYRMNPDGSGIVQLTHQEEEDALSSDFPAWSPDGSWIAVARSNGFIPRYGLALVRPDGSEFRTLRSSSDLSFGRPAWSPDGTRLVFSISSCCIPFTDPAAVRSLVVTDADGTHLVPITTTTRDGFPSWSPDGTRIAFQRQDLAGNGHHHIWVVSPDGVVQQQLTFGGTNYYLTPTWSPDGTRIALKTTAGPAVSQLWVMNADGSDLRLLHPGWANLPAWSPFGTVPPP